jgi:hypothetical protein
MDAADVLLCQFIGPDLTFTASNPRFSNTPFEWTGANGVQAPVSVESFPHTVTLTMQSGSIVLNDFRVGIGAPLTLTTLQLYTAIVPVPEPATISLFALGAVLIPAARYLKRRTTR